jgi:hypothetical protein
MKKMIFLVALAIAGAVAAQPAQKKDAPKPEAAKPAPVQEAAKPVPVQEAAKPAAKKPATLAKKSRRSGDARHCLERGNNTEIIKCAEAYL